MGQKSRRKRERKLAPYETPGLPAWTPLERATLARHALLEDIESNVHSAQAIGMHVSDVARVKRDIHERDEIYTNSRYQVNVRRVSNNNPGWPDLVHLSIKRRDKQPMGPEHYRDFMRIRDELLGPEVEAVELYPARSREVDTANQYHLWAFDAPGMKFPFGFDGDDLMGARKVIDAPGLSKSGTVQAPFEEHHTR